MLEFLATDDAVASLEAAPASSSAATRAEALVTQAWHLRQRDTPRALALAAEAGTLLAAWHAPAARTGPAEALRQRLLARLLLIRGEAHWLGARLEPAREAADTALHAFEAMGDAEGRADAHWLRAMLAIDRGDWPAKDAELEAMAAAAQAVDTDRVDVARAAQAYFAAFRDRPAAQARWAAEFGSGHQGRHPAAGAWAEDFLAVCAHHASDFVAAMRHFIAAYRLALASGQPRRAVIAATNTGDCLNHLNDYQGALEWQQRGLDLARQAGWPGSMGVALLQTAHTMRLLGRLEAGRALLHEALALMAPLAASRNHAYALWHLSEVELAANDFESALRTCTVLAERADALQQADLQSFARSGRARALLALGRPQEAIEAAQDAHRFGEGAANVQIAALRVMADIHAAHALAPPPGLGTDAPSLSLHYLGQALALASGIEGFTVPADLLDAAAREHARLGDFERAYALSQRAGRARESTHNREAGQRADAMHVTHETDRALAEADHQRRLARAHAERLDTLELLGTVGREITRNLEPSAVFAALDRHVRELFDATALVIYRMAADGAALEMAFGVEAGAPLPAHALPIGHPLRQEARCAREAREIVARLAPGADDGAQGRLSMRSLMCAPLQVGDRLLGVMSIRSVAPDAYGEREVALFRTLCAYGAIALSNADVQAQLVEKNLQLEVLSASDRLTGLFNRLRLDQVLKEEQQRRARTGADLSVILLDLDHFRAVNDAFGHPVGDRVLASAAALLKAGARQTDVVGRWGGEEFLVICRETDLAGALVLAEKLRAMLAAHDFGDVPRRTGSFGAATLRPAEDVVSLIARVDAALYRAKHLGRDRVEAEEPPAATMAGR